MRKICACFNKGWQYWRYSKFHQDSIWCSKNWLLSFEQLDKSTENKITFRLLKIEIVNFLRKPKWAIHKRLYQSENNYFADDRYLVPN